MNWPRRGFAYRPTARLSVEPLEARLVPTVTYHGGNLLPNVEVQGVYLGADWGSSASLNQSISNYEAYLADIVNSGYMDMLTNAGYRVGRGTAVGGYLDPTVLDKGHFLSDARIESMLQADISSGALAPPDANRLYVVFVEPDVVVRDSFGGTSTQDFAGYHGAFAGSFANGQPADIRYAVVPYAGGSVGNLGIGPGYSAFQSATVVASHETTEAVTDPDIDYKQIGWYDDQQGAEIGDLAVGNFVTYHDYLVQAEVNQNDQLIYPSDPPKSEYTVAEFPGAGVWRFTTGTGWQRLTSADATQVAVDENGDVVADFPGAGVFRFKDATGWQRLTNAFASSVAIAGKGNVAASFSGAGVYRYEDATGWQQLTPASAIQVSIDARGDVAASFSGAGVYRFEDATGWQQLTSAVASSIAVAGNGNVAANFSGAGVYRFEDATGWQRLTSAVASSLAIDARGDVAASFSGAGVFRFEDATGWQRLNAATSATQVAITGAGDVLVEFAGAGLYLFRDQTGWQQLNAATASGIGLAQA
jgi:hypothetical protein